MKHLLLIAFVFILVSCGNNADTEKQIALYKDSLSMLAKQQSAIVDSPYPDTDTGELNRKLKPQKIELQVFALKEKIKNLEAKK